MIIMKRIIVFFAVIVQMVFLSCCVEKQGYYDSGEESIIALICDITWTGGKKEYEDGSSWESIWNFDKDGTYTRANVEIDKDGNKKEGEIRGRWSFATPNFSTLYFGGSHYWDIKELDKTIFSFYDRTGELNDPTTSKEYVEFYPYNDGKTNYTRHYKIFCVNGNTGFRNESRIFYFIHLQNEEAYERKESSSA